jgi:hypothetical protein
MEYALMLVIVIVVYITRKSIVKWAKLAEKKSDRVFEEIEFDVAKDLGKLKQEIEEYEGPLATSAMVSKQLHDKMQEGTGEA